MNAKWQMSIGNGRKSGKQRSVLSVAMAPRSFTWADHSLIYLRGGAALERTRIRQVYAFDNPERMPFLTQSLSHPNSTMRHCNAPCSRTQPPSLELHELHQTITRIRQGGGRHPLEHSFALPGWHRQGRPFAWSASRRIHCVNASEMCIPAVVSGTSFCLKEQHREASSSPGNSVFPSVADSHTGIEM